MRIGEDAEVEVKLDLERRTANLYFKRTNSLAFYLPDLDANECRDLKELFRATAEALDIMPLVKNGEE